GEGLVKTVEIQEGTTLRQVAALLQREQLLRHQWGLILLGKLTSSDRRIVAGEYALRSDMTPKDLLAELRSGHVVLHAVTIPEGYTAVQIAELLDQKGIVDGREFLRLVHDRGFIRTLNLDTDSLEGYLFPDTYRLARGVKSQEMIAAMVAGLRQVLTPELQARAKDVNMSLHDVLTLASVIEKESGVEAERELVSAVFHNRLRRHIPLQSDPTVIYGIQNFNGNLTRKDLAAASPYNTYRNQGLPPGPIANPGAGSIRAALYPVPTSYLYFVSRNDGTHEFSSTLAEHNRAVDRYQRHPQRRQAKHVS
ncbi:MAG: endolytic transglycosylase MltG, partial [Nitrospiraceae bacterium]